MSIMFPPIDPMSGTPPALTREQDEGMGMDVELDLETGPNYEMEVPRNKGKQKAVELVEGDYEDDGDEGRDNDRNRLEKGKGKEINYNDEVIDERDRELHRIHAMIDRGELEAASREVFSAPMLRFLENARMGFINTVPSVSEVSEDWPGEGLEAGMRPEHLTPSYWQVHPSSIRDSYGHLLNPQSYTFE
ncbi:hypothetical protein CVT25_007767 [Psilocybe cyanescens]|uniref:Uncharacterized protein n=1 Tax=Psilocybe cyanescens TaxID=93625 RepID=A0A409XHX3_PSICY|nr:hypothetical protein CVT25_007767 [Psilocybe cyanescens]